MKILVTGGGGFIGSHLCKYLLNRNHEVICLDNFSTGQKENIKDIITHQHFRLMEHDIIDPFDVEVDQIYNLACPASPKHYQRLAIETLRTSVIGAYNCLELAKKLGNIKILQTSTSEVYGDPKVHPQRESYFGNVNPIGPRACYDEGKRAAETLFFDYHRKYHVPIKVVRIFNTYGPQMAKDDGRVVSNFIVQALRGIDITVHGDGTQTRSFCYVSDMVLGIVKMMESHEDFLGPVNLGNPNEFTIKELAQKVVTMTGEKGKIVYHAHADEDRVDDPKRRRPDISLAKEKLQWSPTVALGVGLKKTIEYFQNTY